MKQEDRQLLLKDLSARLPYHPMVFIHELDVTDYENYLYADYLDSMMSYSIRLKPYLRPMSSMTEEERKKYNDIVKNTIDFYNCAKSEDVCFFITPIDYLNSIHVDYRGLIKKGLAIEVTKDNNPYKEINL